METRTARRALFVTFVHAILGCILLAPDIAFHISDIVLTESNVRYIFLGSSAASLGLIFLVWFGVRCQGPDSPSEGEDNLVRLHAVFPTWIVEKLMSKRKVFPAYRYYTEFANTLNKFDNWDMWFGFSIFVYGLLGFFLLDQTLFTDAHDPLTLARDMMNKMNGFSFIFVFFIPLVIIFFDARLRKEDMLRTLQKNTNSEQPPGLGLEAGDRTRLNVFSVSTESVSDMANTELADTWSCENNIIAFNWLFGLLALRFAYLIFFDVWGNFTPEFLDRIHDWPFYVIAAIILILFHIALTMHVIESRNTWYADGVSSNVEANKDKFCNCREDFFPCGTQLLSLATICRALAGIIVISSGDTELTKRISPLFLDLMICIIMFFTLRILLFTDVVLLDLMEKSKSIVDFRKDKIEAGGSAVPATEDGLVKGVFATSRPSY